MTFRKELEGGYFDKINNIRSRIKWFVDEGHDFAYLDYEDEEDSGFKVCWVQMNLIKMSSF